MQGCRRVDPSQDGVRIRRGNVSQREAATRIRTASIESLGEVEYGHVETLSFLTELHLSINRSQCKSMPGIWKGYSVKR